MMWLYSKLGIASTCALVALSLVSLPIRAFGQTYPIGINDHPYWRDSADLSATENIYASSGTKYVRIDIPWFSLETANGVYSSGYESTLNSYFSYCTTNGIHVLASLAYAPEWENSQNTTNASGWAPANNTDFANFAVWFLDHYATSSYVCSDGKHTLDGIEIWNEPDEAGYFLQPYATDSQAAGTEYGEMVVAAGSALKSAESSIGATDVAICAPVISGPSGAVYPNGSSFMDAFYAVSGVTSDYNVFTWHSYWSNCGTTGWLPPELPVSFTGSDSDSPPQDETILGKLTDADSGSLWSKMVANGDSAKPNWCTETGAACSLGSSNHADGYLSGDEENELMANETSVLDAGLVTNLARLYWYEMFDEPGESGSQQFYGILALNDTVPIVYSGNETISGGTYAKPAYATYVGLNKSGAGANIANGSYKVECALSSLYLSDPSGGGSGTGLEQQAYSGADQQWTITSLGTGFYEITCAANGLALSGPTAEAQLQVQAYTGAQDQQWSITPAGSGEVLLTCAGTGVSNTGEVMNDYSGSMSSGTVIGLWPSSVATNQQWILTSTSGGSAPSAPTNLAAAAGNAKVTLTWTGSSGATSYNVYRGTSAGGESSTPIATGISASPYTNTGLTNGTTYYYKVKAVNSYGTSPYSNEASAKPKATSIAEVQATSKSDDTDNPFTTYTLAFTGAQTAGDVNVVDVGYDPPGGGVRSVTDTEGNTYTLASGPTNNSGGGAGEAVYYATNIKSAGANTVTVTFGGNTYYPALAIMEVSGVSAVDKTATGTGDSTAGSTSSATTTVANEMIVGPFNAAAGFSSVGSGFTLGTNAGNIGLEYKIVSSTGSYKAAATFADDGYDYWAMNMVTMH